MFGYNLSTFSLKYLQAWYLIELMNNNYNETIYDHAITKGIHCDKSIKKKLKMSPSLIFDTIDGKKITMKQFTTQL